MIFDKPAASQSSPPDWLYMPLLRAEVKELTNKNKDFSKARRQLTPIVDRRDLSPADHLWARQQLALCTYKDPELQAEDALQRALAILTDPNGGDDLDTTTNHETLSLAGAIHKRMAEISGNGRTLRRSLAFYRRARDCSTKLEDWTYAAVNLALILDLVAREEDVAGDDGSRRRAAALRAEAEAQRRSVLSARNDILAGTGVAEPWWPRATLVEAHFGLGDHATAGTLLEEARRDCPHADWQLESLVCQLAALARLRADRGEDIGPALDALAGVAGRPALHGLLAGKVGLALSGGGFRASLFHVGVLARLAELDLLRHVEVLSCVSGGSILGALYYLELRRELERLPDAGMDRDAYIRVVERTQDRLLAALRTDLRSRALLRSLPTLLHSRTVQVGTLLYRALYQDPDRPSHEMSSLIVQPKDAKPNFHPKRNNWNRNAKVPILIVNATALNTGHNWQFTASWMGEAPSCIEPSIDSTERLRRLYYKDAPDPLKGLTLETAVAASAAVPGLFRPIRLDGLYPIRTVRLCDGGVNDNQGIFGLLEQGCTVMLVSDGCGQLATERRPSWFFTTVVSRTNDILMDTVRRNSFRILSTRLRSGRLRGLSIAHLKQGLPVRELTWLGGSQATADALPPDDPSGLDEKVQRALAAIRTDLDRFSETECHALMYAGYHIAGRSAASLGSALPTDPGRHQGWRFLGVAPWMQPGGAPEAFLRELTCACYRFLRPLRLSGLGRLLGWDR
ncbi:patatin-like phospholipase family protein [Azospirillum sp. TSH100]|uniref:patatin-like phospholipase family protein n=1 Tax=Azospirillum sp. TSH100 TaxID=652764 RepID=UPI0013047DB5|nr:patatin-like phospholipase family protein [Azospirillum sp. TSH100]